MTSSLEERGSGWIAFAGIMLIIAGALSIVNGLWALDHKDSAGPIASQLLYENKLETWGWIMLIWGILVLAGGLPRVQRLAVRPLDRHPRGGDRHDREHDVGLRVPGCRADRGVPGRRSCSTR